jgi:hypothetical protein
LIVQGDIGIGGNDNGLRAFVVGQHWQKVAKMSDQSGGFGPAETLNQGGGRFAWKRGLVHFWEVKSRAGRDGDKGQAQKAQKLAPARRG